MHFPLTTNRKRLALGGAILGFGLTIVARGSLILMGF